MRPFSKAFFPLLILVGLLSPFTASAGDTNGPLLLGAKSYDGVTVLVCFDEPLDEISATNTSHYLLHDPKTSIVSLRLEPDRQSVLLNLAKPLSKSSYFISWTNIQDTAGNKSFGGPQPGRAICVEAVDIGAPGIDPLERGRALTCDQLIGGGSGIEGTNDGCFFLYREWTGTTFWLEVRIISLEPVSRLTKVGLMARKSLDPGSPFYCVMVTPPDVPCRDGSGNGANEIQATYRQFTNGPVKEWPDGGKVAGVGYPDAWLWLLGSRDGVQCHYRTNRFAPWEFLSSVRDTNFFGKLYIGLALTSANNRPGFAACADWGPLYLDEPEISRFRLAITRSGSNLNLIWPNGHGYVAQSSTDLRNWMTLTNEPMILPTSFAEISLPVPADRAMYFRLKNGLFKCLQD